MVLRAGKGLGRKGKGMEEGKERGKGVAVCLGFGEIG